MLGQMKRKGLEFMTCVIQGRRDLTSGWSLYLSLTLCVDHLVSGSFQQRNEYRNVLGTFPTFSIFFSELWFVGFFRACRSFLWVKFMYMVAPSKAFAFFGRRHIEWVKYWEMPSPKTSLFTTPWLAKMLWWWGNEKYGLSVGGKYWQMSTPKTFPSIAVEQKSGRSQESAILDKSHFPHHYIYSC